MADFSAPSPTTRESLLSILTGDAFKPVDPLAIAKMTPAVTARRVRLQKYVKMVVGGCAALCLVAGVRVAVASEPEDAALASAGAATMSAVHKAVGAKSVASFEELRAGAHGIASHRSGSNRHR